VVGGTVVVVVIVFVVAVGGGGVLVGGGEVLVDGETLGGGVDGGAVVGGGVVVDGEQDQSHWFASAGAAVMKLPAIMTEMTIRARAFMPTSLLYRRSTSDRLCGPRVVLQPLRGSHPRLASSQP